jgi:glutamate 5-kinase
MKSKKRILIKVGTNLLTDENQELDLNNMRNIVFQITDILRENKTYEFIMVSSGAITCGAKHINIDPCCVSDQQAAAAIGQILLFKQYYDFFKLKGYCIGQLLLTKENFSNPIRKTNIHQTIQALLTNDMIPIINENDSVATDEIQFGDNDQLSALIAINMDIDQLIILSNIEGLLDANHNVIPELFCIGNNELALVNNAMGSATSKGGMTSKLMAAKMASDAGIPVTLANGRQPNIIDRILNEESVGTRIKPKK